MRITFVLLIILVIVASLPAQAQDGQPVVACDGGIEWFEAAIEPFQEFAQVFSLSDDWREFRLGQMYGNMEKSLEAVTALEYPPCIENTRTYLLGSYRSMMSLMRSAGSGSEIGITREALSANFRLGRALGFMEALGWTPTNDVLAFDIPEGCRVSKSGSRVIVDCSNQ